MDDQAKKLRLKMNLLGNEREGKTISVISGKGGVGKSNFALNFSIEMLRHKKKVVLIDLDVGMGNINILLGLRPKRTIVDLFEGKSDIADIIEEGPEGLAYIAGGSGLTEFFMLDEDKKNHFFKQYNSLTQMYDYIIFDLGAGVTKDSLFFVLASDECIVITTSEPTSITDAYSMIKYILSHGNTEMPIRMIMNRAKSQEEGLQSLQQFQEVVRQFLQIEVHLLGIIPEDNIVAHAVIEQTPYLLLNKNARASKAIHDLTKNYMIQSSEINVIQKLRFTDKLKSFIAR